jgi:hypothetical protein
MRLKMRKTTNNNFEVTQDWTEATGRANSLHDAIINFTEKAREASQEAANG